MQVRVKDLLYVGDEPVIDPETKEHKRNRIAFLWGRKAYLPGAVFEMPDELVPEHTRPIGGRMRTLETVDEYRERLKRQQDRADAERIEQMDVIEREMQHLDRHAAAAARMRQLIKEKELQDALQQAPGAAARMVIEKFSEANAQHDLQLKRAEAQVPAEILERLARLEEALAEERRKVAAAEAQAKAGADAAPVADVKSAPEAKPERNDAKAAKR